MHDVALVFFMKITTNSGVILQKELQLTSTGVLASES